MTIRKELFISVDIEASGPAPGIYSMLSLGACVVGHDSEQFYVELLPINNNSVPGAMTVVGRSLDDFARTGKEPSRAMWDFRAWVQEVAGGASPVFVGFNAAFDWSFVNWYFNRYDVVNPFGVGGLDIKAFYMGMSGCTWDATRSSQLPEKYKAGTAHSHHALEDAVEQARVFEKMAADAGVI